MGSAVTDVLAGAVADPGQYQIDIKKIVAFGKRVTVSSGSTGTAVTVLRIDGVPVKTGRLYAVWTSPLVLDSTVNNDVIRATIRFTADESTATEASTVLPGATVDARQADATVGEGRTVYATYEPASDLKLSLVLCVARAGGSGTCTIFADGTNFVTALYVADLGKSPGDTGLSL